MIGITSPTTSHVSEVVRESDIDEKRARIPSLVLRSLIDSLPSGESAAGETSPLEKLLMRPIFFDEPRFIKFAIAPPPAAFFFFSPRTLSRAVLIASTASSCRSGGSSAIESSDSSDKLALLTSDAPIDFFRARSTFAAACAMTARGVERGT